MENIGKVERYEVCKNERRVCVISGFHRKVTALFWVIMQEVVVISYQRVRATYRSW
jgi:hypothetical protein